LKIKVFNVYSIQMNNLINKRRVVITGLGLITPLGIGVNENWTNLRLGNEKSHFIQLSDGIIHMIYAFKYTENLIENV
jgi:3-oxoacyl-(acyl-carrier-protein) synthase